MSLFERDDRRAFGLGLGNMSDMDPAADLRRKFPKMKLTKGAPTLFTLNGCGLGMYGRRNFDDETGTYLKTRWLCLVFVPLIALGTYSRGIHA